MWLGLQAGRFLPRDMIVGGPDYNYWRSQLADLTDKHLDAGLTQTNTFKGYLTWSEFRKLCMDGYNVHQQQRRSQYKEQAVPRLSDPASFGRGERWKELAKVTKAMMEEPPGGPIHRAALENRLTKRNIDGKSADEIIEFCNNLYS